MSPEASLTAERAADSRHESYAGESFAMAGGPFSRALLVSQDEPLVETRSRDASRWQMQDTRGLAALYDGIPLLPQ